MKTKQKSEKKFKDNLRWQALKILDQIEHQHQYSNVVLDRFLTETDLSDKDQRLLVKIVYGVIQRRYTLDYYLAPLLKGKKVEDWVGSLLRLSVYQIVYLDRIPSHAVVNEAVSIAKVNGHQGLGNFVNGVLRHFLRNERPSFEKIQNPVKRLSIQYSVEEWIVEKLLAVKTLDEVENILVSLIEEPFVSARINRPTEERHNILEDLTAEGFSVEASPLSPYGIRCMKGNLIHSTAFSKGILTIQDESSMLVAPLGGIQGNEQILDACSAPGGKATHIASFVKDGHLTALDISEGKLKKVAEHMERMDLADKVSLFVSDATKFYPKNDVLYDIIYLDAPCSGLGLMRRKPEIKYLKTQDDVIGLAQIQLQLLEHMSQLLKDGGTLVYSTCTITEEENESVLERFTEIHPEFSIEPIQEVDNIPSNLINEKGQVRVWPNQYHTDGFFIARLKKNN